jgi:hypothetical protein
MALRPERRRASWYLGWLLVTLLSSGFVAAQGMGQGEQGQSPTPEYQLKAVFLFNFAQFVAWPDSAFESPTAPLVIGVLGSDPFGALLEEAVQGEVVNGHPLSIRRFSRIEDVDTVHILFLGQADGARLAAAIGQLRFRPILTVGESDQFARSGGMIGFVMDHSRIRLRINRQAAEAASLQLSSRLLRPAEIVSTGRP